MLKTRLWKLKLMHYRGKNQRAVILSVAKDLCMFAAVFVNDSLEF